MKQSQFKRQSGSSDLGQMRSIDQYIQCSNIPENSTALHFPCVEKLCGDGGFLFKQDLVPALSLKHQHMLYPEESPVTALRCVPFFYIYSRENTSQQNIKMMVSNHKTSPLHPPDFCSVFTAVSQ